MDARFPETIHCAASYTIQDGMCCIVSRHLCDPHTETITLSEKDGVLEILMDVPGMLAPEARRVVCRRIG